MRNVVIDVPFQSDRFGLTSAMPSPAHAPHAAKVKWPGRRTRARIDEAVAAFAEARDEAARRAARREGRASCLDAPEPPGSMMSFQSDRPLLVATYSPFQRIVVPLA